MNSATFSGFARIGIVALVLVLAIVAGLVVGNAINGRGGTLNAGYPAGYQGAPEYVDYVDQARQRSAATDPVEKAAPAPMAPGL